MKRPIEIVTETWFSPELHTMVLRKHSDPRLGETTYRLTESSATNPTRHYFSRLRGLKFSVEPVLELHKEIAPQKNSLFSPLWVVKGRAETPGLLFAERNHRPLRPCSSARFLPFDFAQGRN